MGFCLETSNAVGNFVVHKIDKNMVTFSYKSNVVTFISANMLSFFFRIQHIPSNIKYIKKIYQNMNFLIKILFIQVSDIIKKSFDSIHIKSLFI